MSDDETGPEEKLFCIEVAKQGRAGCKKCKDKCLQGEIRIAKLVANPFGDGKIKAWHHINCIFEVLLKQRPTTKRIEGPDDIDGWNDISKDDQDMVLQKIEECNVEFYNKHGIKPSKKSPVQQKSPQKIKNNEVIPSSTGKTSKDNLFKEFRRLISDITNHSAYLDKTNCVRKMFTKGTDGNGFKGNIILWCQLLLPGVIKRVYNLQSKQLIKLFSRIFGSDHDEMLEHLEQGDIGETVQFFFENSHKVKPAKNSKLTVEDVDKFLQRLSQLTREEDQIEHLQSIISKCTSNDLKLIIRLIKGDLRMGAGAKHILDGVHPDAYEAYQASRDIQAVISKCLDRDGKKGDKNIEAGIKLMTPVLPMLAEACKSVEQAMKKCPNGMYSEIKYDGERVQVHKRGTEFKYFSRALKPVLPHKIQHFKDYIPQAFPHGHDMILDSEILMIDTNTGKPLPFGTLGKHKKAEFQDANVCLFVFDCLYYNGERLFQKPLSYRKKILRENMKEISNRLMFSEMEIIHKPQDLVHMIAKVLKLGLEGLVLKDIKSTYEPGKRHWLKVKKDYLLEGAMADSADLLVLGAWYGTGKKGGMMSVFLMGCYNPHTKKYCTVTKVHTGHDDKTLEKLQSELEMEKISQDASKVPNWLKCTKTMIPDFVAKDPKKQPVWEITGAEFTQHDVHTADGISIRFPRVTRIRDDKNWETATNLEELQQLYKNSKENIDVSLLIKGLEDDNSKKSPLKRKTKKHDENEQSEDESTASDDEPSVKKTKKKQIVSPLKKKNKKPKLIDQSGSDDDVSINSDEHSGKKMKKTKGNTSVSETTTNTNVPVEILNPFPDYFESVKALLEEELKKDEHADLLRCFVAYGGTIVEPEHWKEATHVFHYFNVIKTPVIKCPYNARHLSIEWIKDSVAEKCLQDSRFYTVQWDPEM